MIKGDTNSARILFLLDLNTRLNIYTKKPIPYDAKVGNVPTILETRLRKTKVVKQNPLFDLTGNEPNDCAMVMIDVIKVALFLRAQTP